MRISDWSSDVCSSDLFACGKLCRPFGLEALAVLLPARDQGVAVPHLAPQHLVGGDDAAHLRLDQRQFVVAERAMVGGRRKIIVKAVGGDRKGVVSGKRVAVSVEPGGHRRLKKKKN